MKNNIGALVLGVDLKPIDNELVPECNVLSKKEEEELLERMKLTKRDLPKIKKNDPVVVALIKNGVSVNVGDIIEFKRKEFGNEYSYYRVVIE